MPRWWLTLASDRPIRVASTVDVLYTRWKNIQIEQQKAVTGSSYFPTRVSCWSVDTVVTRCHEACCFGLNEEHNHKGSTPSWGW
ncbi:hypothetical protein LSAT2_000880 [Lamellibrachia satsuma]|nr:hypothetical protein LSAT2_000880 [Lamellibrachia satsuma]